jgi:hypothetical protein
MGCTCRRRHSAGQLPKRRGRGERRAFGEAQVDGDDLLDRGRIGRVAEAFVARGSSLVIAGHRGRRAAVTGSVQQHRFHVLSSLGRLSGHADRRARLQARQPEGRTTSLAPFRTTISTWSSRLGAQAWRRRPGHRPRNRPCARDGRRRRRPRPWLLIGPDTAGNLLEVVVLITAEGMHVVIHAMPMRDKYARLLEQ